jgi:hypothetical protein
MAEALAIIGGLAAVLQLAGLATNFSGSLIRTAREAGSAKDEIEAFALDIGASAQVIQLAHKTLVRHCEDEGNSDVLRYVRREHVLESVSQQSALIEKRIRIIRPKIRKMRSDVKILLYLKWIWKRQGLKELHPRMESVKSNMNLLALVVLLEVAIHKSPNSAEHRQEMLVPSF